MTRVLIVDDSALMRRLLLDVFSAEGDFEVFTARSGEEALAQLAEARPDVITLDIHMPGLDGLACLDRIMLEHPTPVVMFSSLTEAGAQETLEALQLGAVDFVLKPSGAVSLKIDQFGPLLVEKVRNAAQARLSATYRLRERVRLRTGEPASARRRPARPAPMARPVAGAPVTFAASRRLVLVGCSTGGPPALDALLAPLPQGFPWPILVAQHMPASFTAALARRLDKLCALDVSEVTGPTELQPGHVYIGRGDADLLVSRRMGATVALSAPQAAAYRWHPSVDRLVASAMEHIPAQDLVGVLMTGMGTDGAEAMTALHAEGGATLAESEESAVVWGMPGDLVRRGGAQAVKPLEALAAHLIALAAA